MARALNQREKTLLGVFAIAGLVGFWMFGTGEDESAPAEEKAKVARQKALEPAPTVNMALVDREVEPFEEGGRDLFKYAQRPPSARELARMKAEALAAQREAERLALLQAEAARRQAELEAARQAQLALLPPPPPPKPQPPFIGFKYIGYLGPKEDRIAVFDEGGETFLARRGEVVREQFKVVDIKYDTVVMGFVRKEFQADTRELRLSGKTP